MPRWQQKVEHKGEISEKLLMQPAWAAVAQFQPD